MLTISPSPTTSPRQGRDVARGALDAYVDALARQDFASAFAVSAGAAHRLALVRFVLSRHNSERGGTTTVSVIARRFTAIGRTARRVSFDGSAIIRSTVRTTSEPGETTERTIDDPVVELVGDAWRVTGFRWANRPIVTFDAGATDIVGDVRLRLDGSIAFGDVVGILVVLIADGERTVRVDADRLRVGGEDASSGFHTLIGGQPGLLYLTYPRVEIRPEEWRARVSVDGADEEVALRFD